MKAQFFHTAIQKETRTALQEQGFTELPSAIYEPEKMLLVIVFDAIRRNFWITDEAGLEDLKDLADCVYKSEIPAVKLEDILDWDYPFKISA